MSEESLISIRNLHATAGEAEILKGIDLEIRVGEIHAVMGPNGSGKSTLSNILVGKLDMKSPTGRSSSEARI